MPARVGDVLEVQAADGDVTVRGWRQARHHPHRGGLAGAVGPQEAGHCARLADEADVVDGDEMPVGPREPFDLDHGSILPVAGRPGIGPGQGPGATKVGGARRLPPCRPVSGSPSLGPWTVPTSVAVAPPVTRWGRRGGSWVVVLIGTASVTSVAQGRTGSRRRLGVAGRARRRGGARPGLLAAAVAAVRRAADRSRERRLRDCGRPGGPGRRVGGDRARLLAGLVGRAGKRRRRAGRSSPCSPTERRPAVWLDLIVNAVFTVGGARAGACTSARAAS